MSRITRIALTLSLTLLMASWGSPPVESADTTPEDVTREYTRSLNTGETEPVLKVLHPESPQRKKTRVELERLNRIYTLKHELVTLKVLDTSDTQARVRFVHRTSAEEPEFRDNRLTGLHVLRKHDGVWKIYETRTLDLDYLDDSED